MEYHPSWTNAPKSIEELHEVFPLLNKRGAYTREQIVKLMSHVIYDNVDEINLEEEFDGKEKLVRVALDNISTVEGGIFDLADIVTDFILETNENEDPKKMADKFADKVEEADKKKKAQAKMKQGGNKPGEFDGHLWSGEYGKMSLNFHNLKNWPAIQSTEIVKNGLVPAPEWVQGKPKDKTVRQFARNISDLKWCTLSTLAKPEDLFWLLYAKGQLEITKPYRKLSSKQKKIVLLDDSSSMDTLEKRKWLERIFGTLLLDVLNGNSVLYFTPFTYMRNPVRKIETEAEVMAFCEDFRRGTGGGTNLAGFLPNMIEQIKRGELDGHKLNNRTEMLIINDGEDSTGSIVSDIPIHCISIDEINYNVKEVCNASGGQYFQAQYSTGTLQLL